MNCVCKENNVPHPATGISCWQAQAAEVERLRAQLKALYDVAYKFAGKFGGDEHPVEKWFDKEFVALEIALSDLDHK